MDANGTKPSVETMERPSRIGQRKQNLGMVGINRLVGGTGLGNTTELHVFCDASLEGTAAVAYIKTTSNQGTTIRFMGKTRVAPLRQTTIPRLKLQAALYAARLKKTVEDEVEFKFDKIFSWSDNTTVLSWIKNFKLKKMYIGNRIAEIRDLTSTYQLNYVNAKDNPADQGTRGLKNLFGYRDHSFFYLLTTTVQLTNNMKMSS